MVGNHVFMAPLVRRRKTKFPTIYPTYTSPNENFEYCYPLIQSSVKSILYSDEVSESSD